MNGASQPGKQSAETQSESAELDWLAFQYVADELSAVQAAEFEQRLETEQAARLAVARMTRLTQAVVLAERDCAAARVRRDRPRTGRRAVPAVVAVCAAAVMSLGLLLPQDWRRAGDSPLTTAPTERLALEGDADSLVRIWSQSGEMAADWTVADHEVAMTMEDVELSVPGWLMAAVSSDPQDPLNRPSAVHEN